MILSLFEEVCQSLNLSNGWTKMGIPPEKEENRWDSFEMEFDMANNKITLLFVYVNSLFVFQEYS